MRKSLAQTAKVVLVKYALLSAELRKEYFTKDKRRQNPRLEEKC